MNRPRGWNRGGGTHHGGDAEGEERGRDMEYRGGGGVLIGIYRSTREEEIWADSRDRGDGDRSGRESWGNAQYGGGGELG